MKQILRTTAFRIWPSTLECDPAIFVAREQFAPDFGILGYIRFDGALTDTAAIKVLTQAQF